MLSRTLKLKKLLLEPHFKPNLLQRSSTVFQFQFTGDKNFFLYVTKRSFEFNLGNAVNPTLTLLIDRHETCWELLTGNLDGMTAFMNGNYRADGNIVLSQLLLYLFRGDES